MQDQTVTRLADWPTPVERVNAIGRSPLILVCEHATNHVPSCYRGLGLSPADLDRHIAWDIGAAALTRRLAELPDAPALLGAYSRPDRKRVGVGKCVAVGDKVGGRR